MATGEGVTNRPIFTSHTKVKGQVGRSRSLDKVDKINVTIKKNKDRGHKAEVKFERQGHDHCDQGQRCYRLSTRGVRRLGIFIKQHN